MGCSTAILGTWLRGFDSISLTLLPYQARTSMTHPRSIQDAYDALAFGVPFLCIEEFPGRTAQGAIKLESECVAGKAVSSRAARANFGGP